MLKDKMNKEKSDSMGFFYYLMLNVDIAITFFYFPHDVCDSIIQIQQG